MTHATTTTSASHATIMGNGNRKHTSYSLSADDLTNQTSKSINNKEVSKWSSTDVQYWIKKQCKKYELKKTSPENFEINGPALMLLTKHDFIRRSPDGGEILYYALQSLINPNKVNPKRLDQSVSNGTSLNQHPRIVEITEDYESINPRTDSSSPKPIIEEPDDPPKIRRSQSDTHYDNYQQPQQQHQQTHPFFFRQVNLQPPVLTMTAGSAAAFFNQQAGIPNAFMYTQHHHHPHLHVHQPFIFQPHLLHQYHPVMSAQGILIEVMDDNDPNHQTPHGAMNGAMNATEESLYMVTINGQRYIMNEAQVRQLVTEVYQRQAVQANLQRQHILQQQQQFLRQQQQQFQQHQQHFQQQQHPQHFQQQHQQQEQQPQQQHF